MGFVERLYKDLNNGYFEKGFIHDFNNGRNIYCIFWNGCKRFYESTKPGSNADKIIQQFITDEHIAVTEHFPNGCM